MCSCIFIHGCVLSGGYIQVVLVTFIELVILSGSSMVLSSSCNWVNEYISFVCGCELCGVCGLMSEMCV